MSYFKRVWSIISPLILLFAADYIVSFGATYAFVLNHDLQSILADQNATQTLIQEAYTMLMDHSVLISLISAVVVLPFLFWMFTKEKKKRNYTVTETGSKPLKYVFAFCLSAGVTLAVNLLLNALVIFQYTTEYQEVIQEVMAESLPLKILSIGIMMPVVEELIFRGLIYQRLKRYSNAAFGAVLSSLIFALYHGNIIQGIYAFLLGWLIVYAYQKTGTILVPIFMHIVSNLIGIGLNYIYIDSTMIYSAGIVISAMIAAWGFIKLRSGVFCQTLPLPEESADGNTPGAYASFNPSGRVSDKGESSGEENIVRNRPEDYYPKEAADEEPETEKQNNPDENA